MNKETATERFHFLDALRCFASLIILFHHSFTMYINRVLESLHLHFLVHYFYAFMQSGVELFFTLSGIVLLRPYLQNNKQLKVFDYYKRRFTRIYPPFFIAAIFACVVSLILTKYPSWYTDGLPIFEWKNVPLQFYLFTDMWNYFNPAWWSLKLEILFYILCPIVIIAFRNVFLHF